MFIYFCLDGNSNNTYFLYLFDKNIYGGNFLAGTKLIIFVTFLRVHTSGVLDQQVIIWNELARKVEKYLCF